MAHNSALPPNELTDFLVDYRRYIIFLVLLLSTFFAAHVRQVTFDSSLRAFYESSSPEFKLYQRFLKIFGNDELLLAAIKYDAIDQAKLLDSLDTVTKKLGKLKHISESISLTNVTLFGKRGGTFGSQRLVSNENGLMKLPSKS